MNRNNLGRGVAIVVLLLAAPQLHAEARPVPPDAVDRLIAERVAKEFDGNRARYFAWLRAQGKTHAEDRAEVASRIAEQTKREEASKSQVDRK